MIDYMYVLELRPTHRVVDDVHLQEDGPFGRTAQLLVLQQEELLLTVTDLRETNDGLT